MATPAPVNELRILAPVVAEVSTLSPSFSMPRWL